MVEVLLPILIFLALLVLEATHLPLLRVDEWWVRIFDFPRLQLFSLGAVLALGLGYLVFYTDHVFGKWALFGLIACLINQG